MSVTTWFWIIMAVYVITLVTNSWRGRRSTTLESYALGRGRVKTSEVAWSITTAVTSPATFLGIAGFAYVSGLSALWWLVIVPPVFVIAMRVVGPRFKAIAHAGGALSLPHWLGHRYQSTLLRILVSLLYLLNIFYLVGNWTGISLMAQYLAGEPYQFTLFGSAAIVALYVLVGGNVAVIKTDVVQGYLMIVASLGILVLGFFLFDGFGDVSSRLSAQSENLVRVFNPEFAIFSDPLAVSGLVVFWLIYTTQPHVAGRFLVLNHQREFRKFFIYTFVITAIFMSSMVGGLYARSLGLDVSPDESNLALALRLPSPVTAVVFVAITAAALSTVSVVIITIATVVGNDMYLLWAGRSDAEPPGEAEIAARDKRAKLIGRFVVVATVAASTVLALNPPHLISVFSAIGLYGFFAGVAGPLILGLYWPRATTKAAIVTVIIGPCFHLILYYSDAISSVFLSGSVATVFGFVLMFVVSLFTQGSQPKRVVEQIWNGRRDKFSSEVIDDSAR